MKLVGATNWFIRGPFMLEGLITGIAGALLAVLLLVIARVALLPHMRWANAGPDVHALEPVLVGLILVGMGLTLGAVGSGLTIRRFLRV
jgi:cell division transport system permease protein